MQQSSHKKRNVYAVRVTFHPSAVLTSIVHVGLMGDVITHVQFQLNQFSRVRVLWYPQFPHFLYIAIMTLTNSYIPTVLFCDTKGKSESKN